MITGDEAITQDQTTPSVKKPGYVEIFYPRDQRATVLSYQPIGGTWTLTEAPVGTDNGFTQWFRNSAGNYENGTDKLVDDPTIGPGIIVPGLQSR